LKLAEGLQKNIIRVSIWPFKKEEVKEILATIERQKTVFLVAIQNDHM